MEYIVVICNSFVITCYVVVTRKLFQSLWVFWKPKRSHQTTRSPVGESVLYSEYGRWLMTLSTEWDGNTHALLFLAWHMAYYRVNTSFQGDSPKGKAWHTAYYRVITSFQGDSPKGKANHRAYLIFVTCTTCGVGVKFYSLRSKNQELTCWCFLV